LAPEEKRRQAGASFPNGRMVRPEEIDGPPAFLANADADYFVVQTHNIDGGNWISRVVSIVMVPNDTGISSPTMTDIGF
jgi:hypothetical protein